VAAQAPPDPPVSPVTLAIAATDKALADWFRRLIPEAAGLDERRMLATGRLALLLCDGHARWPDAFLNTSPPEEFARAMRGAVLKAGPELRKGRMVPRPRDWGFVAGLFGGTLDSLDRRPYVKTLLAWLIAGAVLAYLFGITR
jgi:hypothetical protein